MEVVCIGKKLVASEHTDAVGLTAGKFKRDHHIRHQKRVLQKESGNCTVFLRPIKFLNGNVKLMFQKCCTLGADTVNNMPRPAPVIIVNLCPWPFQVAMMVKQLQPPQKLLGAAAHERDDMPGTE